MKNVTINGKKNPIHFGWGAIREFGEETNTTLNGMQESFTNLTAKDVITLIWIGLKHGSKYEKTEFTSTTEDVEFMMDENPDLMHEAFEYFALSMGRLMTNKKAVPAPPQKKSRAKR